MKKRIAFVMIACLLAATPILAGGPLIIFDPFTETPYAYPGPVAVYTDNDPFFSLSGPVSNAAADAGVVAGFAEWAGVPSATFSGFVAGDFASILIPDITLANVFTVVSAFNGGGYHVIYDHDGSITAALAGPGVLGFSGPEFAVGGTPDLLESMAVLNGATVSPGDVVVTWWQGVMTHEFGHGINLAHTQLNGAVGFFGDDPGPAGCAPPYGGGLAVSHLETMYPFLDPSIGGTGIEQGTIDRLEDISSVSDVYPAAGWPATTASIEGKIFRSDGVTEVTGVNVIARNVLDPWGDAISQLSGAFTQGLVGNDGRYRFHGLTPGADYVVYVDGIVAGGFSTTPTVPLPGPEEFYNGASESGDASTDDPCDFSTITAVAGVSSTADIVFNFAVVLGDDDFVEAPLPFTFNFCGVDYNSVFIGSNGFVTFGAGATFWIESVGELLNFPPRIAMMWDDLSPNQGGTVTAQQVGPNYEIEYIGIPQFFAFDDNNFKLTLRPDNTYNITYGNVDATDGLVGRSGGFQPDPGETDVTAAAQPIGTGQDAVYEIFQAADNDLDNENHDWDVCERFVFENDPATPGTCYASTGVFDGGRLLTVDINNGAATPIGPTGFSRVPGLAIDSQGNIYGSSGGINSQLIIIDATTGVGFPKGPISTGGGSILDFVDALAFDDNDVLYAMDDGNNLYTLDPSSGAATFVGFSGITPSPFLVGLTFDLTTGKLFASTGGLGGADAIYEIDASNGVATFVGNTGLGSGAIPDLHVVGGMMFGSKNLGGGGGGFNLITVNKANGAGGIVGPFGVSQVSGLAAFALVIGELDIKPTSCPNPVNVKIYEPNHPGTQHAKKGGVLPVAILGTADVDVNDIDVSTLRLEGVEPIRWNYDDVAEPVQNPQEDCDCTDAGPDGLTDLTLKFQKSEIVSALGGAGALTDGALTLTMTGKMNDGTNYVASDCVVINTSDDEGGPMPFAQGPQGVLYGPAPNPFNPVTTIRYDIGAENFVQLTVYDVTGRLVERLVAARQKAGRYTVVWEADHMASGVYFARLEVGSVVETRKMILLK